jgi:hypothetical protein
MSRAGLLNADEAVRQRTDTKPRRHNGAVRTLADLHGRCVENEETGCWHMRDGEGRPLKLSASKQPRVHWYETQKPISARRLGWLLSNPGKTVPRGKQIAVICGHADCINPKHTRPMSVAEVGALTSRDGRASTPAKRAHMTRMARSSRRVKLTFELAQWARESGQTQVEVAWALDCAQGQISKIRRNEAWCVAPVVRGASVFSWAGG